MAKNYYKTIQGVRYDRALLEVAEDRIHGQGDGRISKKDAEEIVESSKDGGRITETELRTLKYISENYHFTSKAAAWFAGKLPDIVQAVDPDQFDQAQPLTQQLRELDQTSSPLPEQDLSRLSRSLNSCRNLIKLHLLFRNRIYRLGRLRNRRDLPQ